LTLLAGQKEGNPACEKNEWSAGMVTCLGHGANLHMAKLMPLPVTDSFFSKIQTGLIFPVPAELGSLRQRAIKWVLFVVVCFASSDYDSA